MDDKVAQMKAQGQADSKEAKRLEEERAYELERIGTAKGFAWTIGLMIGIIPIIGGTITYKIVTETRATRERMRKEHSME